MNPSLFFLHSIISRKSLVESRHQLFVISAAELYDELGVVGEYAKKPFDRSTLKDIMNQLHMISRDADSLIARTY
jgi:L-asparaginase II